ncbi:hypothetical protein C8R45DRAFT_1039788 [Mycena sanguinolenta]|nr:hypothetical protein C8R45DRAFT_1039788 [Mycena sanguinolenta]
MSRGFRSLPCELHREIVRWSKPKDIMALTLTSESFNQNFEPILYRTVVLHDEMQCRQLYRAIDTSSPRHLQRRSQIKHLGFVFPQYYAWSAAEKILSTCDDIVDFFILGGDSLFSRSVGELAEQRARQIRISRLSVDVLSMCKDLPHKHQPSTRFVNPGPFSRLFSRLTHLDVRSDVEKDEWSHWTRLATLPALTHLAFHVWGGRPAPFQVLTKALIHCKSLRVLILFHTEKSGERHDNIGIHDSRFCIRQCTDAIGDWVDSCRGDNDFWH